MTRPSADFPQCEQLPEPCGFLDAERSDVPFAWADQVPAVSVA
jgi:hypothetical protein